MKQAKSYVDRTVDAPQAVWLDSRLLLMRYRTFFSIALLAISFLLHSSDVLASPPSCGASVDDAIAATEKAIAAKDAKDREPTLACLTEAVKRIAARSTGTNNSDTASGSPVAAYINAMMDTLAENDPTFRDRFLKKLKLEKP